MQPGVTEEIATETYVLPGAMKIPCAARSKRMGV